MSSLDVPVVEVAGLVAALWSTAVAEPVVELTAVVEPVVEFDGSAVSILYLGMNGTRADFGLFSWRPTHGSWLKKHHFSRQNPIGQSEAVKSPNPGGDRS
jgi:hypothetical protein